MSEKLYIGTYVHTWHIRSCVYMCRGLGIKLSSRKEEELERERERRKWRNRAKHVGKSCRLEC